MKILSEICLSVRIARAILCGVEMVFCPHACLTPTPNLWRTGDLRGSPSRGAFASVGASELAPSPRRKRTKRLDGSLAPKASRAHFSRGGTMTSLGRVAALCVALCLCWSATIEAFYLPGVAPQDYERVSQRLGEEGRARRWGNGPGKR